MEASGVESRYRSLFEHSLNGILLTTPDGQILAANPAVCQLLGYTEPELRALGRKGVVDPADPRLTDALEQRKRTGSVVTELTMIAKDGRRIPVEMSSQVFVDDEGREQTSMFVHDLSERKNAEAALRESESLFRSAMEYAAIGKAIVDLDGRFLQVNRSLCEIVGYTEEELLATTFQQISHPHDLEADLENVRRLLAGEIKSYQMEKRYFHRQGHPISVLVSVSLAHDDAGAPRYFISQIQDVTERKVLETQLRQAQKMEAIGQLAGGVAHDFNNVLTAITCHVDLVREALPAESELRADLDEITKGAARAARLTHQLLAFSRRQVLQPSALDLNEVVDQLREMLRRLLGPEIAIRPELSAAPTPVLADKTQLEQVIVNLAINARDAMPRGGILRLRTETLTLGRSVTHRHGRVPVGTYVRLTVSDSGSGMDEDTLARVFEPFFTTKPQGKGTGLGLATVHGIVLQSGGHIVIDSAPGRGTAVEIYLPRRSTQHDTGPATSSRGQKGQQDDGGVTPLALKPLVLVTDDEAAICTVACRILERAGYRTTSAANGLAALEAVRRERPDLVLTDLVMPIMDGRALGRALHDRSPDLPVLYMSGYTQGDRGRLTDPTEPFIGKPFTSEQLLTAVARLLGSISPTA